MTDPRWLDDEEQRAWRAYLRMHTQLTAQLGRALQTEANLSLADYDVLVHLTEAPQGHQRPFELQQTLQWEQSRLSHQLSRMERRGLIQRQRHTADRRGALVALTPAGRAAIEAAAPGHVAAVRRLFFDRLSHDQVTALEQLATRVLTDPGGPRTAHEDRQHGRMVGCNHEAADCSTQLTPIASVRP